MTVEQASMRILYVRCEGCGRIFRSATSDSTCPQCVNTLSANACKPWLEIDRWHGHDRLIVYGQYYRLNDAEQFKGLLEEVLAGNPLSVALEFRECFHLDSNFINILVKALRNMVFKNRPFCLIASNPILQDTLRTVGLDKVAEILPQGEDYATWIAQKTEGKG